MITFLISIALFHIYNFVINKDELSSKVLDHNRIKETEDTLKAIEIEISELNKENKNTKIDIFELTKEKVLSNSIRNLSDRCINNLRKIDQDLQSFNDQKNELKNDILLDKDFKFGFIKNIIIRYLFTGCYFLLLFSYFVAGNIGSSNTIFFGSKSFLGSYLCIPAYISEFFFFVSMGIFFYEILLIINHKNKHTKSIIHSLQRLKNLKNNISISRNNLFDLIEFDLKDLKNDLKVNEDEIPF